MCEPAPIGVFCVFSLSRNARLFALDHRHSLCWRFVQFDIERWMSKHSNCQIILGKDARTRQLHRCSMAVDNSDGWVLGIRQVIEAQSKQRSRALAQRSKTTIFWLPRNAIELETKPYAFEKLIFRIDSRHRAIVDLLSCRIGTTTRRESPRTSKLDTVSNARNYNEKKNFECDAEMKLLCAIESNTRGWEMIYGRFNSRNKFHLARGKFFFVSLLLLLLWLLAALWTAPGVDESTEVGVLLPKWAPNVGPLNLVWTSNGAKGPTMLPSQLRRIVAARTTLCACYFTIISSHPTSYGYWVRCSCFLTSSLVLRGWFPLFMFHGYPIQIYKFVMLHSLRYNHFFFLYS